MLSEFSAQAVTLQVLEHLERHRPEIVADEARVRREVEQALVPVRASYDEAQLPVPYYEALAGEVLATVPEAWRAVAARFTDRERRDFGLWRGGDPVARLTYVLVGLVIGGLCVALPFIPIWEKWFPFLLAAGGWWVPTAQIAFHKRRYAQALGQIAIRVSKSQPQLDGTITTDSLLLPEKGDSP